MIKSPETADRVDRLAAFFNAYPLEVRLTTAPGEATAPASALHLLPGEDGEVRSIALAVRGPLTEPLALMTAGVFFGGQRNPLLNSLPDLISVPVCASSPALQNVVRAFRTEAQATRCGQRHALDCLGEVIVLMVLRAAIEAGASRPCLLAGLAHPQLHRVLVSMHEAPAKKWTVNALAQIAGMSRSRFMVTFLEVVGTTPMAYLTRWRLQFGQLELRKGNAKVKAVARLSGFQSAEAFSRAYSREFGRAPTEDARM